MSLIHETMVKEETEKLYKTRFMCIFNTGAKTLIKNKDLLGFLSFGQQYQKYMCIKKMNHSIWRLFHWQGQTSKSLSGFLI